LATQESGFAEFTQNGKYQCYDNHNPHDGQFSSTSIGALITAIIIFRKDGR
jgi:hypothetical protein